MNKISGMRKKIKRKELIEFLFIWMAYKKIYQVIIRNEYIYINKKNDYNLSTD